MRLSLLLFVTCFCSYCAKHEEPFTKEKAERIIRDTLKNDTKLDVITHTEGNTLYVYMPTKEKIYEVKRLEGSQPLIGPMLIFTGIKYDNPNFTIEYTYETFKSETTDRKYTGGFDKTLTPYASKISMSAFNVLTQALTLSENKFTFFVLIIADINEGIEIRYTIHERDLKKWLTLGQGFNLVDTIIVEAYGSPAIEFDKSGRHINYKDIAMTDFLCDRVYLTLLRDLSKEVKEQRAEIPWSKKSFSDTSSAILKIFNDVLKSYDFFKFRAVTIRDVYSHQEKITRFTELLDLFPQ